jgi:DNA-binding response OmpR family regulator
VRIALVDSDAVRAVLVQDVLEALGHKVCSWTINAEAAVDQLPAAAPDIVLLSIEVECLLGVDGLAAVRAACPAPLVLIGEAEDATIAARLGASAMLDDATDPVALAEALAQAS